MAVIMSKQFVAPKFRTPASDLEVGGTVFLNVEGVPREFIIIHQGNPDTSFYHGSCDGTWLMMKDILYTNTWGPYNVNYHVAHNRLTSAFVPLLDADVQECMHTVIIPYAGLDDESDDTVFKGSEGLSGKAFLLSVKEIGATGVASISGVAMPKDGVQLDYFKNVANGDSKLIAYYDGVATKWFTRTRGPTDEGTQGRVVWTVTAEGTIDIDASYDQNGHRPVIILPPNATFSTKGTFMGVV